MGDGARADAIEDVTASMRQLTDTPVAQGWRSSVFLFRQPFVLVPGVLATIGVAVWLVSLTIANGRASVQHVVTLVAVAPLCGFGFAMLTALPAFMIFRAFGERHEFTANPGESVILVERANHFLRDEGRGGTLTLTDRRIVFVPHRFNVQLSSIEQPLDRVRDLEWTRVVTGAGVVLSNILHVKEDGRTERYVVKNAMVVGAAIEEARERRRTAAS